MLGKEKEPKNGDKKTAFLRCISEATKQKIFFIAYKKFIFDLKREKGDFEKAADRNVFSLTDIKEFWPKHWPEPNDYQVNKGFDYLSKPSVAVFHNRGKSPETGEARYSLCPEKVSLFMSFFGVTLEDIERIESAEDVAFPRDIERAFGFLADAKHRIAFAALFQSWLADKRRGGEQKESRGLRPQDVLKMQTDIIGESKRHRSYYSAGLSEIEKGKFAFKQTLSYPVLYHTYKIEERAAVKVAKALGLSQILG